MSYIQLWLSCADKAEADKIAEVLLDKKLIACAKQLPVKSTFSWEGKTAKSEEIWMSMESIEDLFDEIETEVAKLHSYETFVLTANAVTKISKEAEAWMKKSLK